MQRLIKRRKTKKEDKKPNSQEDSSRKDARYHVQYDLSSINIHESDYDTDPFTEHTELEHTEDGIERTTPKNNEDGKVILHDVQEKRGNHEKQTKHNQAHSGIPESQSELNDTHEKNDNNLNTPGINVHVVKELQILCNNDQVSSCTILSENKIAFVLSNEKRLVVYNSNKNSSALQSDGHHTCK